VSAGGGLVEAPEPIVVAQAVRPHAEVAINIVTSFGSGLHIVDHLRLVGRALLGLSGLEQLPFPQPAPREASSENSDLSRPIRA
jgi:hypothetical protein